MQEGAAGPDESRPELIDIELVLSRAHEHPRGEHGDDGDERDVSDECQRPAHFTPLTETRFRA